jgi:phosphoribosylamine--glycine ligase
LEEVQANWADDHALSIVIAAKGYPGAYQNGSVISGLDNLPEDSSHMVFHAGTTESGGQFTATGGRVLNITARGTTLSEAHEKAYAMAKNVDWSDGFYRSDIGWRAL